MSGSGDATLKVNGVEAVSGALRRLSRAVPAAAAAALNAIAERTMTDAKERTPVLTGNLRRSGKVEPMATPQKLSATLSFGTEYAIYVHERVHVRHANGEAKFLENALKKAAATFERDVAAEIKASIGGGA